MSSNKTASRKVSAKKIYFNSQLTARPSKEVAEKMSPYIRERWTREETLSALKEPTQALYNLVGAKPADSFMLTASGAEGVNQAVFAAYLDVTRKTGKNHFITSNIDEAPAIMAMSRLQEMGCVFEMAPANREGLITVQAIAETITPRTAMLSLSWANGLTGVIQPVAEIAELCRDRDILFHVEATHVLGKGLYSLEASGADILTFNGEQLHGPKGTGALFVREGIEINPLIMGVCADSLNVAGLIGLGQAAKEGHAGSDHICMEGARLRSKFEKSILAEIPSGQILFGEKPRLPNITAMAFPAVTGEALHYLLHQRGIYTSFGGGHFQQMLHVLKACGIKEPLCHSTLSFALSRDTTEEEVEQGAAEVVDTVLKLRSYSKHLREI